MYLPFRTLGLGLFLLAVGSVTSLSAAETRLTLTGSSTVAPLAGEIARRYETLHPDLRIDVQAGGSTRGITDVRSGRADIGLVSRGLKPEEKELTATTIALDGIACIAHRDNPVRNLTRAQVIDLFTGKLTDWNTVGGSAMPVTIVNKAEGTSTLELFLHHFGLKAEQIKASVIIGDNAQGIKTVAGNPAAIGYVSLGAALTAIDAGVSIRLLALDGKIPTVAGVLDNSWPIARPLNFVCNGAMTPAIADFVAFAHSKAVDDLISELAFVPPPR